MNKNTITSRLISISKKNQEIAERILKGGLSEKEERSIPKLIDKYSKQLEKVYVKLRDAKINYSIEEAREIAKRIEESTGVKIRLANRCRKLRKEIIRLKAIKGNTFIHEKLGVS